MLTPSIPNFCSSLMRPAAKHHPAAFINAIKDEGDKAEAIEWLQSTWDELQNLRQALIRLGFTPPQIEKMMMEGSLGKVF